RAPPGLPRHRLPAGSRPPEVDRQFRGPGLRRGRAAAAGRLRGRGALCDHRSALRLGQ
ncbi:unnamed protein product, partial [Prorocentrum cordatum]